MPPLSLVSENSPSQRIAQLIGRKCLFVQTPELPQGHVAVKVGRQNVIVRPGCVAHIKSKIPTDFSSSVALFEVSQLEQKLDDLDIGDGLVEVHRVKQPYVKIPVGNHTQQNITITNFTRLGNIQPIDKIVETDERDGPEVNKENSLVLLSPDHTEETDQTSKQWSPPVDLSHLTDQQQAIVRKMLQEESNVFARDENDMGCIPNLKMSITLKDDVPVQQTYAAIPKPLYKEVKEYIQDLLAKQWIVKSKFPYAAPVVCVRKKRWKLASMYRLQAPESKDNPRQTPTPTNSRSHRYVGWV